MWPFSKRVAAVTRRPVAIQRIRNIASALNSRFTTLWNVAPVTADTYIHQSLRTLRARSRERAVNDDYAKRFLNMVKRNVVGSQGMQLQAQPLDSNGSVDTAAAQALEAAWGDWHRPANCSFNGTLSFLDIQSLAVSTVAKDGETLIREWKGGNAGPYAYSLQMLDAERLPIHYNETLPGNRVVRFGIEYSPEQQILAYHIVMPDVKLTPEMMSNGYYTAGGRNFQRVPADQIIHLYLHEIVEQKRGLPWMTTPMERMKILSQYEQSALVAAQEGANKVGFIIGGGQDPFATELDEDGQPISESASGEWHGLPADASVQTYDPTYPNNEFDAFTKRILRGIASGLDVSYNMLANDGEGINWATIRHFAIDERDAWKALQSWLALHLMDRVYRNWLRMALTANMIQINGRPLPVTSEAKYQRVRWQGKRWQWVDPQKESTANATDVELRTKSRSQIIRDMGNDPDDTFREIQREEEQLAAMGLMGATSNE